MKPRRRLKLVQAPPLAPPPVDPARAPWRSMPPADALGWLIAWQREVRTREGRTTAYRLGLDTPDRRPELHDWRRSNRLCVMCGEAIGMDDASKNCPACRSKLRDGWKRNGHRDATALAAHAEKTRRRYWRVMHDREPPAEKRGRAQQVVTLYGSVGPRRDRAGYMRRCRAAKRAEAGK